MPAWLWKRIMAFLGLRLRLCSLQVAESLGPEGPWLLVAGGLSYSIGGLIYAMRWPDPSPEVFGYHEIFHMLVIIASALHFAAIYLLVQKRQ